jgi:hypothetical protein
MLMSDPLLQVTLPLAYVGPGGALTVIGSFLALFAAVLLAFFGFIWYPLKRLLRWRKERRKGASVPGDADAEEPRA